MPRPAREEEISIPIEVITLEGTRRANERTEKQPKREPNIRPIDRAEKGDRYDHANPSVGA